MCVATNGDNDVFLAAPPDDWSDLPVSLFQSLDLTMEQRLFDEDNGEEQTGQDEFELAQGGGAGGRVGGCGLIVGATRFWICLCSWRRAVRGDL